MSYDRESSTLRKESYNTLGQQASHYGGLHINDDIYLETNDMINPNNYRQKVNGGSLNNSINNAPYGMLTQQIIQQSNHKPTLINHQFSFDEDGSLDRNNLNYISQQMSNINNQNPRSNFQSHNNYQMPMYQLPSHNSGSINTVINQGSLSEMAANPINGVIISGQNQHQQQPPLNQSHFLMNYSNNLLGGTYNDMMDQFQNFEEIKNGDMGEYPLNSENTSSESENNLIDNNNNPDNNNAALNGSGNEKQYICEYDECKKVFKAKKSLRDHLRIHTNQRPYSCQEPNCGKSFVQYSSLQKHSRTHKGDRPYKCDYYECDQAFTQVSNLKRHQKIHSNDKPYECNLCMRKFTTSSNLKQHQITHESQRERTRFRCQIDECGKSYLYSSSLKKHEKEHILNTTHKVALQPGGINGLRQVNENCEMHGHKLRKTDLVNNNIHSDEILEEEEDDDEELQEREEYDEEDELDEEEEDQGEDEDYNQKSDQTKRENMGQSKQYNNLSHLSESSNSQGQYPPKQKKKKILPTQQSSENPQNVYQQPNKINTGQVSQNRVNSEEMDMLNSFFNSHHVALQHDGHYDVLFKGYLYHYNKKTGKIEIHDIQAQDEIKKGTCQPLSELTHNSFEDVQKKMNEIEYRFNDPDILQEACNPLSCKCGVNGSKGCCQEEGGLSACCCSQNAAPEKAEIKNKNNTMAEKGGSGGGCCSSASSAPNNIKSQQQYQEQNKPLENENQNEEQPGQIVCCNEPNCSIDNVILVQGNLEQPVCCVKLDPQPISLNNEDDNPAQQAQNAAPSQVKAEDCCCTTDAVKEECTCVGCDQDCQSCSKSTKCIYKVQFPEKQNINPNESTQNEAQQQEKVNANNVNEVQSPCQQSHQHQHQHPHSHDHDPIIASNSAQYEIIEPKDMQNAYDDKKQQPKCICSDTKDLKHLHGPNCGHIPIYHHGHLDYIVENQLHHPHGTHCDFHGTVNVLDSCVKI